MLQPGPAKKITIHLNEDTIAHDDFLYREIFSYLLRRGVAGATLVRPVAGFGSHRRIHAADADGTASEHLPVRIEFIDDLQTVESLLEELRGLITDGVIEAQDTTILHAARSGARG